MIQSYKNKELDNLTFDIENQQEFKELAAKLGMAKQSSFMEQSGSAMPYPYINQAMQNQFETLCPRKVNYTEYDKTPIPLEIMRELAFVVSENYFTKIEVWYDDKSPDPFLIGLRQRSGCYYYPNGDKSHGSKFSGYEYDSESQARAIIEAQGHTHYFGSTETNRYLIARWGDELRDFAELKKLAAERLVEKYTIEWKLAIQTLQGKMNAANENIMQYLNGDISQTQLSSH